MADTVICRTCGVAFDAAVVGDRRCPVCADERQYVGWHGQRWTTLDELRTDHRNRIDPEGPGVWGVGTEPTFAIGQRALVVRAGDRNVLWDCTSLIDDATVAAVTELGGIDAIAVSHPHFYGSMVAWSDAFGGVPVLLHEADREWLPQRSGAVEHWSGTTLDLGGGLTLVQCGVHFAGGTVLHRAPADGDGGALCTGDIVQVVMDRRWVGFMYSYPNLIPERPEVVAEAVRRLDPLPFDTVYGGWWGRVVSTDAKAAIRCSAERYWRQVGWSPER
jgi:hypothetical protein